MTAYQDPFLVYMKSTFVLSQPCLALGAIEFSILPETHRFFFEMSEVIDSSEVVCQERVGLRGFECRVCSPLISPGTTTSSKVDSSEVVQPRGVTGWLASQPRPEPAN
jgi:hypothetical protein